MVLKKLSGAQAAVQKYDIITALSVLGLNGSAGDLLTYTRMISLLTARYNWRLDELSTGQAEMARMWGVTPRTVKREIKKLLGAEILVCKRQGVKGRVATYRLNYVQIYRLSEPYWDAVGSDYAGRMAEKAPTRADNVVRLDFDQGAQLEPVQTKSGEWQAICTRLMAEDPSRYTAWYAKLDFIGHDAGVVQLRAQGSFVAQYVKMHLTERLMHELSLEFGPDLRLEILS